MATGQEIMKEIAEANIYLTNKKIEEAPFDKIMTGIIKSNGEDKGTYNVEINGELYNNIPSFITANINDTVKICYPQNNSNQMFILGKYGQDEEVNELKNEVTQLKNDLTSKRFQTLDDYKNTSVVSEISNCWIHTVGGLAIVDFGIFLVSQHFGESDLVVFNVPDVFKPSLVFYGTLSSTDGKFSTRCSIETSGEIKISISPDSEKYLGGQIIYLLE